MNPSTPRYIVTIIVCTLSACTIGYMGTLAVLAINNPTAENLRELSTAGIFILGAISAILNNTRSGPAEPVKTETTVTTREQSSPDPDRG